MKSIYKLLLGIFCVLGLATCTIDDIPDPNNPDLTNIENNASLSEIQNLVDGALAGMRREYGIYFDDVSIIGREVYRFSGSDPRYTGELLGANTGTLDAGGFYTVNPWTARYRVVKNCNILEKAIGNTKADVTAEQKRAALGFSKTTKAYNLLIALTMQYKNGIRIDVADPSKLGPFLSLEQSLDGIVKLLDEGSADLAAGGASFPFKLTSGYDGFNTPANYAKFNRAIAARVNAYRSNWDETLAALNSSFVDQNGNLNLGVYDVYSRTGGDLLNEVFYPLNASGEVRVAHPSFVTDAEAGDLRLNKVSKRTADATSNGLTSQYDFALFKTNVDPIPLVRNEELILLMAEANIQKNQLQTGIDLINKIRAAANLPNYTGATTQAALIDEMLKQRRYSLYGECHRWVDMRRYNRLTSLPIDRTNDDVWEQFPRVTNE